MKLDPALYVPLTAYFAMCVIAVIVWCFLLAYRWRAGVLLPREPRRPVPWGPFGFLGVCFFAAFRVADAIDAWMNGELPQETPSTEEFLWGMWASSAVVLFGMAAVQCYYLLSDIADRRDLGWPAGWKEWLRDMRLGLIAALAMIGPVYVIQVAVVYGLDLPTSHPLIDAFVREPRLSVAITAGFSVLVAAPIFEELLFRQLTQGFLEQLGSGQYRLASGGYQPTGVTVGSEDVSELEATPARGWWPILVSSLLFALAHLGQGGAPIPLFFLALGLGYLYQRTHRIVPCIVLHVLFNAFAMVLLGLQVAMGQ